jgi:mono/diheme cytochrome c family protein
LHQYNAQIEHSLTLLRLRGLILLGVALSVAVLAGAAGTVQTEPGTSSQSGSLIYSLKGPDLFRVYCAACHGSNGKGGGPVAPALKAKVPDLTLLAKNNGGQFPSALVRRIIAGDEVLSSHGSREMPIWGPIFHRIESDQDFGNVRIENLVKYLESLQSFTPSGPPSGAELYQQNCDVCHGDDLKGGGPVPYPYRVPPDLTQLARRHGGNFPATYVSKVLRNGVVMPAHGPAEMPIWGTAFRLEDQLDQAQVTFRITALTNYIESRQAK